MFKRPTLFVVGADIDMPVGSALSGRIAKKLDIKFENFGQKLKSGDPVIVDALRRICRGRNENGKRLAGDWLRGLGRYRLHAVHRRLYQHAQERQ